MNTVNSKNIIEFSNDLDNFCDDRHSFFDFNFILLFEKHFGYKNLCINAFNEKNEFCDGIAVNNVEPLLAHWKENKEFIIDNYSHFINAKCDENKYYQCFVTDSFEAFGKRDYFSSAYYKRLNFFGFSWSVTMVIGKYRINIFRNDRPGSYASGEREMLEVVCNLIAARYRLFLRLHNSKLCLENANLVLSDNSIGFIVLDPEDGVCSYNITALNYLQNLFPSLSFPDGCKKLIAQSFIAGHNGMIEENKIVYETDDYHVELIKKNSDFNFNSDGCFTSIIIRIPKKPVSYPNTDYSLFFEQYRITKREREVILGLIKDLSYDQISKTLFISINTVRYHIKSIFSKTNVNSQTALLALIRNSLHQ